tara:strand:+ start:26687 stop:27583 length:897 start_codon:yes stop_codon:yes gene_type:complete
MSIIVNTEWQSEPEIFIGTITNLTEIPNGEALPVLELIIENSFEQYRIVMFQPHPDLQLTKIPDCAVQLVLWEGERGNAVSRSDTVILMDTPDSLLHLPESKLTYPDLAVDIELFLESCPVQPLADFVRRALGRPSVGLPFLNGAMQEAGLRQPGCLARHGLEVAARSFDACRGYSDEERWLAAVSGLLHGLGRIELPAGEPVEHLKVVLKTLGLLAPQLEWLGQIHPEAVRMIQFIIASMYRIGSQKPLHPSAMVVQASHLIAADLQSDLLASAEHYMNNSTTRWNAPNIPDGAFRS